MVLWIGTDAWISCRGIEWDLSPAASSESTGTDYECYLNQGGTTGSNLRGSGG